MKKLKEMYLFMALGAVGFSLVQGVALEHRQQEAALDALAVPVDRKAVQAQVLNPRNALTSRSISRRAYLFPHHFPTPVTRHEDRTAFDSLVDRAHAKVKVAAFTIQSSARARSADLDRAEKEMMAALKDLDAAKEAMAAVASHQKRIYGPN